MRPTINTAHGNEWYNNVFYNLGSLSSSCDYACKLQSFVYYTCLFSVCTHCMCLSYGWCVLYVHMYVVRYVVKVN